MILPVSPPKLEMNLTSHGVQVHLCPLFCIAVEVSLTAGHLHRQALGHGLGLAQPLHV